MSQKILIVHEGGHVPASLMSTLTDEDWQVSEALLGEAKHAISGKTPDCLIVAIERASVDAMAGPLNAVISYDDNLPIIIVARETALADAIDLMKTGVHDLFTEPLDSGRLRGSVAQAMRQYGLTRRVFMLERQSGWDSGLEGMIGHSARMQEVYRSVKMVAASNATVLILGESGTGKELVARAVHNLSPRRTKPFVDINCGAIPRELLENELFGHERGAYTGADQRYKGSCERADGGTLFLDEISEMEPALQVKLLRFLQERSFMRVGGVEPISVDVRVVAATNRDLADEIKRGRFREDLFYRLDVVSIDVPLLKERREDIPLLARFFLERYATKYERMFVDFTREALEALAQYEWPGNVRELENIIERVSVLHNDSRVKPEYLPKEFLRKGRTRGSMAVDLDVPAVEGQAIMPLKLVEKYAIESALVRCMGNVAEAARKLKISQATLYRKIKQYGLKV